MSSASGAPVIVAGYGTFLGKNLKVWHGVVSTDASGAWSADYSSAGFVSAPRVFVSPISSGFTANSEVTASINSRGQTSATGIVTKPNTATITVATIQVLNAAAMLVGSGVQVDVFAIGE